MPTNKTYLALGSNLNNPRFQVEEALRLLKGTFPDLSASRLMQTEPVECSGGPFINAVCSFSCPLSLECLIEYLRALETSLGKSPKEKNQPRPIDIDLLFYGSSKYSCLGYTIPHPSWQKRRFVLEPLLDLTKTIFLEGETIDLEALCSKLP
jgi:2-amino-4-hydroxy-6-hydroxymethyldihydropteridine diphosphokinase